MQTFLAIDIPKTVKSQIEDKLEGLIREYPHFRWVASENYHITLHYFGFTKDLLGTIQKIEDSLYEGEPFYLYSLQGDLYIRNQIVLFISFKREKKLEDLVSKTKYSFGVKEKFKFSPHLTIGRFKIPSKQQYLALKKKLHKLKVEINFPVNKISLFQSVLSHNKPLYKKLHTFSLI